jgi:hypothetical protein
MPCASYANHLPVVDTACRRLLVCRVLDQAGFCRRDATGGADAGHVFDFDVILCKDYAQLARESRGLGCSSAGGHPDRIGMWNSDHSCTGSRAQKSCPSDQGVVATGVWTNSTGKNVDHKASPRRESACPRVGMMLLRAATLTRPRSPCRPGRSNGGPQRRPDQHTQARLQAAHALTPRRSQNLDSTRDLVRNSVKIGALAS